MPEKIATVVIFLAAAAALLKLYLYATRRRPDQVDKGRRVVRILDSQTTRQLSDMEEVWERYYSGEHAPDWQDMSAMGYKAPLGVVLAVLRKDHAGGLWAFKMTRQKGHEQCHSGPWDLTYQREGLIPANWRFVVFDDDPAP